MLYPVVTKNCRINEICLVAGLRGVGIVVHITCFTLRMEQALEKVALSW